MYCETLLTLSRYQNLQKIHVNQFYCERDQLLFISETYAQLMEEQKVNLSKADNDPSRCCLTDTKLQVINRSKSILIKKNNNTNNKIPPNS